MTTELQKYQIEINTQIQNIFISKIKNTKLKEISDYVLLGGKRLRPAIGLDIFNSISKISGLNSLNGVNSLNNSLENIHTVIFPLIISIELLHNTSLILDDLPSMDNDIIRRGRQTIHRKYGVTCAHILATFLTQQSFHLWINSINSFCQINKDNETIIYQTIPLLQKYYSKQMNLATQGQYFDLFAVKESLEIRFLNQLVENLFIDDKILTKNMNRSKIPKIVLKSCLLKTAPFFVTAFVGGYLLGGGEINQSQKVQNMGELFGLLFQISDDFLDTNEDHKWDNYVVCVGENRARQVFIEIWNFFETNMKQLRIWSKLFEEIKIILFKRCKI